jgi:hypothetical protein
MKLIKYYFKESYMDFQKKDWFEVFAWISFLALLALIIHHFYE